MVNLPLFEIKEPADKHYQKLLEGEVDKGEASVHGNFLAS